MVNSQILPFDVLTAGHGHPTGHPPFFRIAEVRTAFGSPGDKNPKGGIVFGNPKGSLCATKHEA